MLPDLTANIIEPCRVKAVKRAKGPVFIPPMLGVFRKMFNFLRIYACYHAVNLVPRPIQ